MSSMGAWGALGGAANALQAYFQQQRDMENRTKMYQMEQDIMQKREEALAQIRANLQDTNSANRSQRAMDRDAFKHGLTSGDVNGAFKDPETGNYYGRTKDGNVVPLNITSDDYQDYKKRIEAGKADQGDLAGAKTQAQIDRTNAQTANYGSEITARDNKPAPDKMGEEIRKSFQSNFSKAHDDWAKQAAAATKAGQTPPPFDAAAATETAKAALYPVYGGDAVNASVGGGANKPKTAPARQTWDQKTNASLNSDPGLAAQSKPGAIPVQKILSDYNTASARIGADPQKRAQLDAAFQKMMTDNGYADLLNQQQQ